jgi:hypothetical protein
MLTANRTKGASVSTNGIQDFNVERKMRSESERRFYLGPYTFKRRPSIPLAVLTGFQQMGDVDPEAPDSPHQIDQFQQTFLACVEPTCYWTGSGEPVETSIAWNGLVTQGDEYDVVGAEDLAAIVQWLISGVADRPTGELSDSSAGSQTPDTGTTSTGISPSTAPASTSSTLAEVLTPPTPA